MEQNIKLKYIKNAKSLNASNLKIEEEERMLDFSRHLAHKSEMPGHAQWEIKTDPQRPCWICDQYIFSLIFWSPSIGFHSENLSDQSKMHVIQQIKDHYPVIPPLNRKNLVE